MSEPGSVVTRPRLAALLAVIALAILVLIAMGLTSQQMSDIRRAMPLLSGGMNWLESLNTPFDMDHVFFFTVITCAARIVLPRLPWWWFCLAVVILAAGTEIMQFWVPGRTPKLLDARDDVIGGSIGLSIGHGLLWMVFKARDKRQKADQHATEHSDIAASDD